MSTCHNVDINSASADSSNCPFHKMANLKSTTGITQFQVMIFVLIFISLMTYYIRKYRKLIGIRSYVQERNFHLARFDQLERASESKVQNEKQKEQPEQPQEDSQELQEEPEQHATPQSQPRMYRSLTSRQLNWQDGYYSSCSAESSDHETNSFNESFMREVRSTLRARGIQVDPPQPQKLKKKHKNKTKNKTKQKQFRHGRTGRKRAANKKRYAQEHFMYQTDQLNCEFSDAVPIVPDDSYDTMHPPTPDIDTILIMNPGLSKREIALYDVKMAERTRIDQMKYDVRMKGLASRRLKDVLGKQQPDNQISEQSTINNATGPTPPPPPAPPLAPTPPPTPKPANIRKFTNIRHVNETIQLLQQYQEYRRAYFEHQNTMELQYFNDVDGGEIQTWDMPRFYGLRSFCDLMRSGDSTRINQLRRGLYRERIPEVKTVQDQYIQEGSGVTTTVILKEKDNNIGDEIRRGFRIAVKSFFIDKLRGLTRPSFKKAYKCPYKHRHDSLCHPRTDPESIRANQERVANLERQIREGLYDNVEEGTLEPIDRSDFEEYAGSPPPYQVDEDKEQSPKGSVGYSTSYEKSSRSSSFRDMNQASLFSRVQEQEQSGTQRTIPARFTYNDYVLYDDYVITDANFVFLDENEELEAYENDTEDVNDHEEMMEEYDMIDVISDEEEEGIQQDEGIVDDIEVIEVVQGGEIVMEEGSSSDEDYEMNSDMLEVE